MEDTRRDGLIANGRYEVLGRLAAGGYKTVWRARDTLLKCEVALAILHEDSEQLRRQFWKEASALSALTVDLPPDLAPFAQRVVAMTDFGELEGDPPLSGLYIATHLVHGETLQEVLKQGVLPWPRAVRIGIGILEALQISHARTQRRVAIVHRDIKPANIILGPDDAVTVLDFGVAKLVEATRSEQSQAVGTLRYMAPEQVEAGSEIGTRADLFAVGVVLHEMLTGAAPWDRDSLGSAIAFHSSVIMGAVPKLDRLAQADLPPALTQVVSSALEVDPAKRPATARAMRAALLDVLEPELGLVEVARAIGVELRQQVSLQVRAPRREVRLELRALRVAELAIAVDIVDPQEPSERQGPTAVAAVAAVPARGGGRDVLAAPVMPAAMVSTMMAGRRRLGVISAGARLDPRLDRGKLTIEVQRARLGPGPRIPLLGRGLLRRHPRQVLFSPRLVHRGGVSISVVE